MISGEIQFIMLKKCFKIAAKLIFLMKNFNGFLFTLKMGKKELKSNKLGSFNEDDCKKTLATGKLEVDNFILTFQLNEVSSGFIVQFSFFQVFFQLVIKSVSEQKLKNV